MAGEKILVVDDEENIRETFLSAFEEEYRITAVDSGQQALSVLRRPNDIELVVLDIMLPDLEGTELLKEIKMINPGLKVVIFTGYSSKEVAIEALRLHADEYIEKPFDIERTRQIFEKLLKEGNSFGEKRIDGTGNKIKQAQRLIEKNYNKSLLLDDVSREIFLSPKYFSRIFKEKTGKSFNEYKIEIKINRAKEFLTNSGYSVSEIAYKVGYQNPESFMKMFKKFTGITPAQYRNRNTDGEKRIL